MRRSDSLGNTIDSPIGSVDSRSIWTWERQKQMRQTESKTNVWNLRFIIVTIVKDKLFFKETPSSIQPNEILIRQELRPLIYGRRLTNQTVRHQGKQERLWASSSSFCSSGENTDRPSKSLSHSFSSYLSRESKFCETMRRRFKGQRSITKNNIDRRCEQEQNKHTKWQRTTYSDKKFYFFRFSPAKTP